MTDFVDKFSSQIKESKDSLKEDLDRELDLELFDNIKSRFKEKYYERNLENIDEDFRVIATDAGRNEIELKNNTRLFIQQAAAVDSEDGIIRSIDVGTLRSFKEEDYESFMQRGSEVQEVNSLLEALNAIEDKKEKIFVLIDGTLLTRLLATPEPLDISKGRGKRLELMEKFGELIEIAEENKNIVLAGISKDSNSSILYRKLLGDLIEDEIKDIEVETSSKVSAEDRKYLLENYEMIRYRPEEIRKKLDHFKKSNIEVSKLERIRKLIEQYRIRFSDTELIEDMEVGEGFTKPLRIGRIKPKFFSAMDEFQNDEEDEFLRERFHELKRKDEVKLSRYNDILEKTANAPGVVTTYWKPDRNDTSLRIDLLNHDIDGKRLMNCEKQEFVEINQKVRDILELLKTGYAGEGMHNVWISQADNSASLKNSDVENIYKPVLAKSLGINLRDYMRRRDKRV